MLSKPMRSKILLLICLTTFLSFGPGGARAGRVNDGEPPTRFNHPYNGEVITRILSAEAVDRECRHGQDFGPEINVYACSMVRGQTCYIVLPNVGKGGVSKARHNQLRRHEIAHCNGWPADHPE